MCPLSRSLLCILACVIGARAVGAEEHVLTAKLHHLRSGAVREWADFPETAEGPALRLTFTAAQNAGEQTLRLRHRDVKQTWKLRLNDRDLGRLPPDENDMVTFWSLPPGALRDGENMLVVSTDDKQSDDVMIGDVRIDHRPRRDVLSEAQVDVSVVDEQLNRLLPCRFTVVDDDGALMSPGCESNARLAVRPGVIYTASGQARFGVPAGRYTLYAGRGFEYAVAKAEFDVRPGETAVRQLSLAREVPTPGYAACDTHCHTLTLSGHGDATLAERVVTVAGEGIELPIATDHNVHADYEAAARAAGVRKYFTPVIGNEVTTPQMGHFNIFPIRPGTKPVNHSARDWTELFHEIRECPDVSVIIFNHPRDLHGGYRPFGPEHHLSLAGENLDGWTLQANCIEAVNSGALQTDVMQVYRDWFGLLNHGMRVTPLGASDSHDVARYFVGQGRTYIRCEDRDPGTINVEQACRNLAAGRALVSLGLLCEIIVAGDHGPGDLVAATDELQVDLRVLGPSWSRATHVGLYANGVKIRETQILEPDSSAPGMKWQGTWRLPRLRHDVHLAAIATGPGVKEPFWPVPRPYQPTSPVWDSYVVGSTGAVWIDADGSGDFNSAFDYASRLVRESADDFDRLMTRLTEYDQAVAVQVARLVHVQKIKTRTELVQAAARTDRQSIKDGFRAYVDAWKECEIARGEKK